jgi:hypothetical protein
VTELNVVKQLPRPEQFFQVKEEYVHDPECWDEEKGEKHEDDYCRKASVHTARCA